MEGRRCSLSPPIGRVGNGATRTHSGPGSSPVGTDPGARAAAASGPCLPSGSLGPARGASSSETGEAVAGPRGRPGTWAGHRREGASPAGRSEDGEGIPGVGVGVGGAGRPGRLASGRKRCGSRRLTFQSHRGGAGEAGARAPDGPSARLPAQPLRPAPRAPRPSRGPAPRSVTAAARHDPGRQMSGALFAPLEGPGGHPLVCPLCHAQYERPCLLDCFHHFCAGCLRGRAADGRLSCPLCQ